MTPLAAVALLPFGFLALDSLRSQTGVDAFHRAGVKGQGVIVGLSEGVDFSLWDFRKPDGSTRFLRYFGKGPREMDSLLRIHYPENRLYPYLDGWNDSLRIHSHMNFHGTAVLSIAAGNGQAKGHTDLSGKYVGMAPEAELVAGSYEEVKALADSLGRPFVYNHSYQSNVGVPPDSGTEGKIVVISSGNAHNHVARHRFLPGDARGLILHFRPHSREFHRVDDSTYLYDVLFRIRYPDTARDTVLEISLHSPNDTVLRYRVDAVAKEDVSDTVRGVVSDDYFGACAGDSLRPFEAVHIGRQESFRWGPVQNAYGLRYRARTRAYRDFTLTIDRVSFQGEAMLELPAEAVSSRCRRYVQAVEFQDSLKATMTLLSHPWNPGSLPDRKAIHVGAYAREASPFPPFLDPGFQRAGDIAYYSGRGDRARSGLVKPEIAAPAHRITAAGSYGPYHWDQTLSDSIHLRFDGTSAAAPVVTGAVALLLQMNPRLDDQAIRDILRENARTDAFTGAVPNDAWGYGKFHLDWNKVSARLGYVSARGPQPSWRLSGPFPNPFRGRTRLELIPDGPDPEAYLEIRDLQGRQRLRAAPRAQGGRLVWDVEASGWPAGIYPYRMVSRGGNRLGKLILSP